MELTTLKGISDKRLADFKKLGITSQEELIKHFPKNYIVTLGKPDPNMLSGICSRMNLEPSQIAMVGDRIYTDIAMAHNAGAFGVLVLSGETTLETAQQAERQPSLICRNIEHLGELLSESRKL